MTDRELLEFAPILGQVRPGARDAPGSRRHRPRGPSLIIDGEKHLTVPWAIANAACTRQRRSPAVAEIVNVPDRGHSLTIDHGWRYMAETVLDPVKRLVSGADVPTRSDYPTGGVQDVRSRGLSGSTTTSERRRIDGRDANATLAGHPGVGLARHP
jgi:hypothetical protein